MNARVRLVAVIRFLYECNVVGMTSDLFKKS